MLKRLVATSLTGATLVAGSMFGVVAGATATPAGATTCPAGQWDATTVGRPPAAQPGANGAAIWRADAQTQVFDVRVSQPNKAGALFTGSVTTDGLLVFHGSHLERGDFTLRRSAHRFVYAFSNFGAVDGFDFAALCSSYVKVSVAENGHPLALNHIVIGAHNTHPTSNPVDITKS